jgi:hypothetical protein
MALLGCTGMPVRRETMADDRMICVVSMDVYTGNSAGRVLMAMTTSSSDVLPARSPMPLTVTSTCRAPACTAASVLAVARPRSSWQCVDHTTRSAPRVFLMRYANREPYSAGSV